MKVYSNKGETLPPIIVYDELDTNAAKIQSDGIVIEFDINTSLKPNLKIIFKFCDKNWIPYDNVFLINYGKNTFANLHFKPAPNGVKGFTYTFRQVFPDEREQVTFPFSGKYIFLITDFDDESKIYAEGKFIVVHNVVPIYAKHLRYVMEDNLSELMTYNRRDKIVVDVLTPNFLDPAQQREIEIIQNQKFSFPNFISIDKTDKNNYYEIINLQTKRFIKNDFYPGNYYRQVNLMNTTNYPNGQILKSFEGVDVSRKFWKKGNDFNGGSIYYRKNDIYQEYLEFDFRLSAPEIFNKDVFIVGSFNNWTPSFEYKMDRNGNYYSKIVTLKRGIYDYQYVLGKVNNSTVTEIDWIELEGSDWGRNNVYYIFAYYNDLLYG
ncbi:MAG: DUF5103 domain-containing protein, partial [Ignavibacteria bacterium]|nr:DUF5103 domain-containing protein [Ignavibacteria bacterium]